MGVAGRVAVGSAEAGWEAAEVPVAERAAWEGELTDELWGEI